MNRTDKMGFPVPLNDWLERPGPTREFVMDTLRSKSAIEREFFDNERVADSIGGEHRYGRTIWGMLSIELWQSCFFDRHQTAESLMPSRAEPSEVANGIAGGS